MSVFVRHSDFWHAFKTVRNYFIALTTGLLLSACTTIPVEERATLRQQLNSRADNTVAALVAKQPELAGELEACAGYFVGRVSSVKAPAVGAGIGMGVLVDRAQSTRTYLDIQRLDLGLGWGKGAYRILILFDEYKMLEAFRSGTWKTALSTESVFGEKQSTMVTGADDGTSIHVLAESGVALTASARLVRLSVNEDLTDSGVSEVSIPNTGFTTFDQQGEDAPRIWEHRLPFLAQKVIDEGYDLPLPYGIGVTYANVNQDMLLSGLEVGINGREKTPFEFVAFSDANAENDTGQLKIDAWLFPFMNVFALLGKIDGVARMDVLLDGNGMLDQLDATCGGFPPNPLCPILRDKTFTLPIETSFSGTTYGIGTILAGGWHNWFVAIPITFTYADMDSTDTDGIALTVTPRFGRSIHMGQWGNLSLFTGGNYLDAELEVAGTVSTPDDLIVIDYTIEQKNEDKWNLLVGGNWDINRRWSFSAEYNGFIGSREAFIMSLTSRF
jgi:hypothetical protein